MLVGVYLCLHVCESVCDCAYVSVCVPTSPLALEAPPSRDHLFPISSITIGRRPVLGQLPSPGWASSGPQFCSIGAQAAPASMLSQRLGQPHKEPSFLPPAAGAWVPPQIINLPMKTFRNSSAALTQACAKAGIPFAVKFYFFFLGGGVRGRGVLT